MPAKYCQICKKPIDRNTFPIRGNVCSECEADYNGKIDRTGNLIMGKEKDVYAAARGSGHFPLSFNFIRRKDGKYIQCSYCGMFIHYKRITRDHVYPKSKGGLIKTPSCRSCNERKQDKLPIEWAIFSYENLEDLAVLPIGSEFNDEYIDEYYFDLAVMLRRLADQKKNNTVVM